MIWVRSLDKGLSNVMEFSYFLLFIIKLIIFATINSSSEDCKDVLTLVSFTKAFTEGRFLFPISPFLLVTLWGLGYCICDWAWFRHKSCSLVALVMISCTEWFVKPMSNITLWPFFQEGDKEFSRDVLDDRTKRAEAWHRNAAARAPYSKPVQPITCATFAQDVLEGRAKASQAHEHKHQPMIFGPASLVGGGLTSERERMAAQVFQPSYRYIFLPLN